WSPAALLGGRLVVRHIDVGTLTVERAPLPSESPSSGSTTSLPLAVALDRLAVERLVLAAPLAGEPATLSLSASGRVRPHGRALAAALTARRRDDRAGVLTAHLHAPTLTTGIELAIAYDEPDGGLLARLANLPRLPAVAIHLDGSGDAAAWRGRLIAEAS